MVTQRRHISSTELVADVKAGLSDSALMEKYQLSEEALQHLFTELVSRGRLKESELDSRHSSQAEVLEEMRTCPACAKRYAGSSEECPACGVIASKYEAIKARKKRPSRIKMIARRVAMAAIVIVAGLALYYGVGFFRDHAEQARPPERPGQIGSGLQDKPATDLDVQLIEAARVGDIEKAGKLVKAGANVNAHGSGKTTALIEAASKDYLDVAGLLLKEGADVNARNSSGETALMFSVTRDDVRVSEFLISKGADVNAKNSNRDSPLIAAAKAGRHKSVALLLKNGAQVNTKNDYGESALFHSAEAECFECAKLLIQSGADVNVRDGRNKTPLMIAAYYKQRDTVDLLLKKGASPDAADNNGKTALMYARESYCGEEGRRKEIVDILRQHGAQK